MSIFDYNAAFFYVFFAKFERKVLSLQKIYKYTTYNYDS